MNDIFSNMSEQIQYINAHANESLTPEDLKMLSKFESVTNKSREFELEQTEDVLKKIKIARKQNFADVKSTDHQLLCMLDNMSHTLAGIDKDFVPSYKFSIDELRTLDIHPLLKDIKHDSYWIIDFLATTIDTIEKDAEVSSGFRYIDGICTPQYRPEIRYARARIKKVLRLDPDINIVDDHFLRLADDYLQYRSELKSNLPSSLNDLKERDMLRDLLSLDLETLKSTFDEMGDDELINYHIFHYTFEDQAYCILRNVRLLLAENVTPSDLCLTVDDNWTKIIRDYLNLNDEKEDSETSSSETDEEGVLPEELQELETKQSVEYMNQIKEEKEEQVRNARKMSQEKNLNAQKSISIKEIETGNVLSFDSKGDAMKWLGTSSATFSQFLKGKSKLNKKYVVL